jgi:hypothetical protein
MLQWIDQNKEWLFSGVAITAIAIVGRPLGNLIKHQLDSYFTNRFFREVEREVTNRVNSILTYGLRESPVITQDLDIDPTEVSLYCVTFQENKHVELPFEEKWIEYKKIPIRFKAGGFSIRKELIRSNLKSIFDPYKFYLEVKNSSEEKQKYYMRLLKVRCIVTGGGEEDTTNQKWRIWFLIPSLAIHADVQSAVTVNHTLINEALVRQEALAHTRSSQ